MDETSAIEALTVLAQPTRMNVFRRLVRAFPDDIPAGELARFLEVPHNTLSTHLAALARAGLVSSTREGRTIRYRAELDAVRALVVFLTQDCCGGRPEICDPLVTELSRSSCADRPEQGASHD